MAAMITNTNVSTPYSFSVFQSIEQIAHCARSEGIAALGINDFNTLDGFKDFAASCSWHGVYPIFNVGFLARFEESRTGGIHGRAAPPPTIRTIHGKALRHPVALSGDSRNLMASIWKASQDRIWKMIDALNTLLKNRHITIELDYNAIRSSFGRTSLLERHLAQAVYASIGTLPGQKTEHVALLRRLLDDDSFNGDPADGPFVQQAIYDRLLTKGNAAYVEEPANSFMIFFQAKQIILQAGGIPCYQCSFTGPEEATAGAKGPAFLAKHLTDKGIHAVEFITRQTTTAVLEEYMRYFADRSFCVTAATGPLTAHSASLVPVTSDGHALDASLSGISYRGACILAAHQELHHQKRRGFIDEKGKRIITPDELDNFTLIGDRAIRAAVSR
ncbi:MAG: hypothetical protein JXA18_09375 [Chitinispirillaceae bacterium]|nr:hypothetical protein [Chitinispirillaceae bacterium]